MSHKVLLIEDEKPIQQIVRDTLEMAGHVLITCDTGEEALEQFHKVKPDVVVLDWMPVSYTHLRAHETG
jgi:two-component system response regulator VicR